MVEPTRALSTMERAFQLARGGSCRTIDDIRRTLKAERYDLIDAQIAGPSLLKQLKAQLARH